MVASRRLFRTLCPVTGVSLFVSTLGLSGCGPAQSPTPTPTAVAVGGNNRSATVALRTRGPVETDMTAYTLRGYKLHWAVTSPGGETIFSEGDIALPTLEPGSEWSGQVEWTVPEARYVLTVSIVRPAGFTVVERSYDSGG